MKINTKKIDTELKRLGWSRYRLAKKMKVKHQWVYYILADGRNCTLKTVADLAKTLEIDPKDLLSNE